MTIPLLRLAASVQLIVAVLNFNLVRILGWRDEVAAMPLLVRQVFTVHLWFISITLAIFAGFTWMFADAIASGEQTAAVWMAGAIGVFWGIRTVLQVAYYSPSHWSGRTSATAIHVALLLVYAGMSALYLSAFVRGAM